MQKRGKKSPKQRSWGEWKIERRAGGIIHAHEGGLFRHRGSAKKGQTEGHDHLTRAGKDSERELGLESEEGHLLLKSGL